MIGAGLIKLRGDRVGAILMSYYHYETQPNPKSGQPVSAFAPHWFHKFCTAWNQFY